MPVTSLGIHHLALHAASDIRELFRLLGYDVDDLYAYESAELEQFELDPVDADAVQRAYIIAARDRHMVYLFEVNDLRQTRLRGLAWNALQRGTALMIFTRDYREMLFVDPRFVGSPTKSNVRVNKLKLVTSDPTRHDLDTRMLQTQAGTAEWEQVNDQLKLFDPNPVQSRMALFESDRESLNLPELRERFFRASPEERKALREEIAAHERRIVFASLHERAEALQQAINQLGRISAQTNGKLKPADQRKLEAATARLKRIHETETELKQPDGRRPFFLYHLHFSEVFAAKGGFDIVVANPPYVRQEMLTAFKPEFEAAYTPVYSGTADLYVYFFARGCQLLKPGGQLAFITTNKFLQARYGIGLPQLLLEMLKLDIIVDFGDLQVFDATSYPFILLAHEQKAFNTDFTLLHIVTAEQLDNLPRHAQDAPRLKQNDLKASAWVLSDPISQALQRRLGHGSQTLEEYVNGRAYYGIKTGLNTAFEIDKSTREQLIAEDKRLDTVIKPWLRGRNIGRWKPVQTENWLLYVPWKFPLSQYPILEQYLSNYRDKLSQRAEAKSGRHPWYTLNRYAADYVAEFEKPKIVYQVLQVQPAFTMDVEGHYLNNSVWMICIEDYYLLGVLNSMVGWYQITQTCTRIQNGYQLIWDYFRNVRIPNGPPALGNQIAAVARQCLDVAKDAPERLPMLEARLNQLVYQAYGLDADDIAVIEGYLGARASSDTSLEEEGAEE